jgi:hypothetical protein
MKYTVLWVRAAERELARLWTTHPDRQAIAAAADAIDGLLQIDPDELGESRENSGRIFFLAPLMVYFRVQLQDRIVEVTSVRYFVRRQ